MRALFLRELRLGVRAGGGAFIGVLFFLAIIAAVPFAVGPDLNLLQRLGPAFLWIGALLSSLLGLDRLFQADREDGSLDLMVLHPDGLVPIIFIKCIAHWLTNMLPLVIAAPLLGLFMNTEPLGIGASMLTLLVGTPAIAFIGATGSALTVTLPRGGLLVSVIILPLVIPVLIFGIAATRGAIADPDPFLPPFLILSALTLFFAVIGPVSAAAVLRYFSDS